MHGSLQYPFGICHACSDLVQSTFVLKSTCDSTNEMLKKLFYQFQQLQQKGEKLVNEIIDEDESEIKFEVKVKDDYENELKIEREVDDDDYDECELLRIVIKEEDDEDDESQARIEGVADISTVENDTEELEGTTIFDDENKIDVASDESKGPIETVRVLRKRNRHNTFGEIIDGNHKYIKKEENSGLKFFKKNEKGGINDGHLKLKLPTNHRSMDLLEIPLNVQNYLCPICRKEFLEHTQLIFHAREHKILKRYLNKNLKNLRKPKFFTTPRQTDTIFNRDEILHKCVFCKEESPVENFQDHIANHFKKADFACSRCGQHFSNLHHLNLHVTLVHLEESPYQCEDCGKQLSRRGSYDSHLLTDQKRPQELPYKCDQCEMRFTKNLYRYRHSLQHTDKQTFWKCNKINKCQKCLRIFETLDEFKAHRSIKCQPVRHSKKLSNVPRRTKVPSVPKDAGVWMCDVCPKTYTKLASFKTHQYYGHAEKVLCELCGANVHTIKQHFLACHTPKEGPFECDICQKKLASKLTLVKHIRVHTGERPYACKFCDKKFKDIHTKCVHERIHVGIKKHICGACGKGFLEKAYMLKHERTVHKLEP